MTDDEVRTHDIAGDGSATRRASVRWRSGRRLAAVATGTTIALGAGGIAYAATTDPAPTPSASSTTPDESTPDESTPSAPTPDDTTPDGSAAVPDPNGDAPDLEGPAGGFGHHGPGGMFFGGGGGMALHGEQVVETEDGVYETIATQRGTVDAVSDDEITVTSEDGYSRTYTLTADSLTFDGPEGTTAADVAVGDEVAVVATVESGTATVTRLINVSDLPEPSDLPVPGEGGPGWTHGHDGPAPREGATETPDIEGSAA